MTNKNSRRSFIKTASLVSAGTVLLGSCQQEQEKQQNGFRELDKVIDRPVLKTEFFAKA